MSQPKGVHHQFLELGERVRIRLDKGKQGMLLREADMKLIVLECAWLSAYIESRRTAALATRNPGRPRKMPYEIDEKSLARREKRERNGAD